ncbi:MAG: FAD-dependent oxidoreductase [Bacteriovoracaceae bacterium]|nr:FAD-dependent oxidoreductase [Bacteriovoracaceae bacterium]
MKSIAIVGTGIAGMSCAYFLKKLSSYDVTLFEKNNYVGGHTNTVMVGDVPIDTGFIVYNEITYPLLTALFRKLQVKTQEAPMSFAVDYRPSDWQYSGSGLSGLFSQKKNIFNLRFIQMLLTINRFNEEAPTILNDEEYDHVSLQQLVERRGYSADFLNRYIIPMSSAVWSTPPDKMKDFPAKTLLRFFYNHGFLGLNTQHPWRTVTGGSRAYREKLIKEFSAAIQVDNAVIEVVGNMKGGVTLLLKDGQKKDFDQVIFACHADEALNLLKSPTILQQDLLSKFEYQENTAYLHQDKSVMPHLKKVWSAWNYRIDQDEASPIVTYYMNILQKLPTSQDYFVSLNETKPLDPHKIIRKITYHHPLFNKKTDLAQKELIALNQSSGPMFFCGSYFRYGFHEDALLSSVNLMQDSFDLKVREFLK